MTLAINTACANTLSNKDAMTELRVVHRCVVCRSPVHKRLCEVDDYTIWSCTRCATDFVWPMPDENALKSFYDAENYFVGGDEGAYKSYDGQTELVLPLFMEILNEFEWVCLDRNLLDIGCAYGTHLAIAAQRGWQSVSVELSEHARKIAEERHGGRISIFNKIERLPPREFDLILLNDVIEHLSDPYRLLLELFAKGTIGPNTNIVITTPNARSYEAISDPEHWTYRHPPFHLVYYSAESLRTLLARFCFPNIKISGIYPSGTTGQEETEHANYCLNRQMIGYSGLLCKARGSNFMPFVREQVVPALESTSAMTPPMPKDLAELGNMLEAAKDRLAATNEELAEARREIAPIRNELAITRDNLAVTTQQLPDFARELEAAKQELTGTLSELSATQVELSATQHELAAVRNQLNLAHDAVQSQQVMLDSTFLILRRMVHLLLRKLGFR